MESEVPTPPADVKTVEWVDTIHSGSICVLGVVGERRKGGLKGYGGAPYPEGERAG